VIIEQIRPYIRGESRPVGSNGKSEIKAQAANDKTSNRRQTPEPDRGRASRPTLPETRGQDRESIQPEA